LIGTPEGKRPLRRTWLRWEDGIRLDVREIGWGVVDWIHVAKDKGQWRNLVYMIVDLRVP